MTIYGKSLVIYLLCEKKLHSAEYTADIFSEFQRYSTGHFIEDDIVDYQFFKRNCYRLRIRSLTL